MQHFQACGQAFTVVITAAIKFPSVVILLQKTLLCSIEVKEDKAQHGKLLSVEEGKIKWTKLSSSIPQVDRGEGIIRGTWKDQAQLSWPFLIGFSSYFMLPNLSL